MFMTQTMRWFGPRDPVPLAHIRQAGATEVVTALHQVPNGEVWTREAIAERKALAAAAGLGWTVVESLPVHDGIKRRDRDWDRLIQAYRESIRNLGACGIKVVTYNFMPLLDWTRTDLSWELSDGARALRFEWEAIAAYDLHILRRPGAEIDYTPEVREAAGRRFASMGEDERRQLERTIIAGLPGSEESFTSAQFLDAINTYADIDADRLRDNHAAFLEAVCPTAEDVGIQLVVHPDDPPFPLFGVPRVVSTVADLDRLFARTPSPANGLCFCAGSFGILPDADLPAMIKRFGSRIGFLHLRAIELESEKTFYEAAHLEGNAGMAAVVDAIYALSVREGRSIPMRPDHGHQMMDDLNRKANPGYSLLGRMRGLAELRGLERGIAYAAGKNDQQ